MQAILDGVNELRAEPVTNETLKEFRELQTEEMRTFVRAEHAPLHEAVSNVSQSVANLQKAAVDSGASSPRLRSSRAN